MGVPFFRGTGPRDAEQLRSRFEREPLPDDGSGHPPVPLTVSIGIASQIPESPEALDTLLTRADDAMSTAKRHGRNKVVLAPSQRY
ncbi:diguanylate cyclase domain-containing protein [Thioalkalivibrio sp. ALgr1]|uniref:GGDEF domain-containing protein n=1 Tax=Thioalkalivibrio sp. ALgr1 TaxID=748655 RepID=UPI000360D65F|nr:diguanylate cyclase [Thioalkalivibrio sp. ALgr1]